MSRHINNPEWYFQFKDGSYLSIKEFLEKHSSFLKTQVYSYVKDHHDVKDILQEVIIKIYKHKDRFDNEKNLVAYLTRCCKNASIDYHKQKTKEQAKMQGYYTNKETENHITDDNEAYFKSRLLGKIFNKWKKLSPKNREILKRTYVEGATNKEIAQHLKTTEAYIKTKKYKILKNFKDQLN